MFLLNHCVDLTLNFTHPIAIQLLIVAAFMEKILINFVKGVRSVNIINGWMLLHTSLKIVITTYMATFHH